MTNINLDDAYRALLSLTKQEIEELAKFKAIELMNETTINMLKAALEMRLVANFDPEDVPICQENLKLLCQAISEKSCNFFGLEISLTGENLCKLIDFMVENEKDDDIRWLQHKILVKCNVFILIYLDFLVQTERFPALAQEVVIERIDDNMELASMFALIGSNK
jgi:hypothetical protein